MAEVATKKSKNTGRIVGTVTETNFKYNKDLVDNFDSSIKGGYEKKEFKNPFLVVRVNTESEDGTPIVTYVKVDGFSVMSKYKTYDGEIKENPAYKGIKNLLAMDNGGVGARVQLNTASLGENSYYKDGSLVSFPIINLKYVESDQDKVAKDDLAEFCVCGVITDMKHEKDADGSETGRLLIDLAFSRKSDGTLSVLKNLVVPADDLGDGQTLAEAFEEGMGVEDRVQLNIENVTVRTGTVTAGKSIGKKKATIVTGKATNEFHVFNGEVLAYGSDEYISEEAFEQGKTLRKAELSGKKKKAEEKAENNSSNGRKSIGSRVAKASEDYAEEGGLMEFDVEEDDNPFA